MGWEKIDSDYVGKTEVGSNNCIRENYRVKWECSEDGNRVTVDRAIYVPSD